MSPTRPRSQLRAPMRATSYSGFVTLLDGEFQLACIMTPVHAAGHPIIIVAPSCVLLQGPTTKLLLFTNPTKLSPSPQETPKWCFVAAALIHARAQPIDMLEAACSVASTCAWTTRNPNFTTARPA